MWDFKREEQHFEPLPEGRYRVRIKQADKATSKNGNDMLVLQLEVSGTKRILYNYIVFMLDRPEITNRLLTQFFDSFAGIEEGDFNMTHWIGQVGAATVKHQEYQGEIRERIGYFIPKDKQDDLPPWKEPEGGVTVQGFSQVADDDIPF